MCETYGASRTAIVVMILIGLPTGLPIRETCRTICGDLAAGLSLSVIPASAGIQ